jgi:hypothetical protein
LENKCKHCLEVSVVIYNDIFLCAKHYKLYLKDLDTTPVRLVHKTALESSLKIKYMKLLDRCMLPEDYEALAIKFKKSIEYIDNPLYPPD